MAEHTIQLLIGTRKGLFTATSDPERIHWQIHGPLIPGYEIQSAWLDPRNPNVGYAAAHHRVWGIHIYRTEDGGATWHSLREVPRHGRDDTAENLKMIWCLAPGEADEPDTLYAGIEPPGIFTSRDRGETWSALPGFHNHPTNTAWSPARGGLAVHSLQVEPGNPRSLYVALSAGGVYHSADAGASWQPINQGVRAPYLGRNDAEAGHCVHRILQHPAERRRLYQQSHHGTYVTDDGGKQWREISAGLPSDFGYALATDPADPDVVYTLPEQSSQFRATVDGKIRVYRSRDAGRNWQALTQGLPQDNAFVTILRDGMDSDRMQPLGLYFGTSSGHLFSSRDGGDHWHLIDGFLPGILSVRATTRVDA